MLRLGCFVFASLAWLHCYHAAAQSVDSRCLPESDYTERLIGGLESQHINQVQAISQALSKDCVNTQTPGIAILSDATTLLEFLHRRTHVDLAKQAFQRLLQQDFSQLPRRQRVVFYHLMARYSLHTGEYKQALAITHIITTELLPEARRAGDELIMFNLAIADIHYQIAFYQSVRELLLPLLEHPAIEVRLRAATTLWYIPKNPQQLNRVVTLLNDYAALPPTLIKLRALEVLIRQALETGQPATALFKEAYQLAEALDAQAVLIRLNLLQAKTLSTTQAVDQLLALAPAQLTLEEQLSVLKLAIDRASAEQSWQQAAEQLEQAVALSETRARNNALAREYASFQMVEQARELEQARQQSRLQALAAEQQQQQRVIYALALVSTVLALLVLTLLLVKKRKAAAYFKQLANTDGLTQVLNRRAILQFAEQVAASSQRLKQSFVVAMADIDHFKAINDTHGHDTGDLVLTEFAQRTRALIRQQDRLGRWGGEEWLIIMTNTDLDAIEGLFKRMQQEIRLVDTGKHQLTVTFSMGAVTGNGEQSIESLIQAADELLYKAKRSGRDRLCTPPRTPAEE